MPNNNYRNGANRERRIMKKLTAEGWFCIRSAGSHSPVDIIAFKSGDQEMTEKLGRAPKYLHLSGLTIRFIQSKATGYLTPAERAKKEELEHRLGIVIEVL